MDEEIIIDDIRLEHWIEEARMYCENAHYWRKRAETAESEAVRYRWLRDIGDDTWEPLTKLPGVKFTHEIDHAIDDAIGQSED